MHVPCDACNLVSHQEHEGSEARTRIGRYRILKTIGRGVLADSHLALFEGPRDANKLVVIKCLRPADSRNPRAITSFMDEARVSSRLTHPNLVQVHEVALDEDDLPYVVSEYIEGQLLSLIRERVEPGLGLGSWLYIFTELLRGLHYAHELRDFDGRPLQIVYRNIHPGSVLITYDGSVKLLDAISVLAVNDSPRGELVYEAPESTEDRRADVYSVGVMLWEALSGLETRERGVLNARGDRQWLSLPSYVPPQLAAVCRRAIERDPADRFASARTFLEALETAAESDNVSFDRPTALGRVVAKTFETERQAMAQLIEHATSDAGRSNTKLISSDNDLPPSGLNLANLADHAQHDGSNGSSEWSRIRPSVRRATLLGLIGAAGLVGIGWGMKPSSSPLPATVTKTAAMAPDTLFSATDPQKCAGDDTPLVELSGDIDVDSHLTCDRRYRLTFNTFVRPGVTLKIDPGTVIVGDHESRASLIVQPGARIMAVGTAERPIVFTSERAPGERRPGDWGGVILLGNAPVNRKDRDGKSVRADVEGLSNKRGRGQFGGDNPDDDSGRLRYVRIEYAGIQIAPNNEVNGLTLAGIGRKTVIDHIQVRESADDCFEFFGGTVDARYLVCDGPGDDGIDWDYGYRGRLQYIVVRSPSGQHGLEGDNDPNGSRNTPISAPIIANVTLCGGKPSERERYGMLLRRGTQAFIYGAIVRGFDAGLDIRDDSTEVGVFGSYFGPNHRFPFAYPESTSSKDIPMLVDDVVDEIALLKASRRKNHKLDGPMGCSAADLKPATEIGSKRRPPKDGFFNETNYAGAFRDHEDNWDEPWVVWEPDEGKRSP